MIGAPGLGFGLMEASLGSRVRVSDLGFMALVRGVKLRWHSI